MADYQEGDTVSNDNGDTLTLQNGTWVPTVGTDMRKDAAPMALRAGVGAMTLPGTMANMAAKGVNAAGDWAFPDWKQSVPGQAADYYSQATEPYSYEGTMQRMEQQNGGPFYTPQRTPTKLLEGAVNAAPMAAVGGESLPLNVIRALTSGAASEGAGELTAGTPYETPARIGAGMAAYTAPGALAKPVLSPENVRQALAKRLEDANVPVSAADISGSRMMSTLEGAPPAGQQGALNDAMLQQGGVNPGSNPTATMRDLLTSREQGLRSDVSNLEKNTTLNVTPDLQKNLRDEVFNQTGIRARSPEENNQVVDAIKEFNARSASGTLPGPQYNDLRERWNSSGIPALRNMASHLDNAMDTSTANTPYAGQWDNWRTNWANLQGLKAASDAAGGEASLTPLNPSKVAGGMYKDTDLKRLAEAGEGILGTRPPTADFSTINNLGHLAAAVGGGLGMTHGTEAGLAGAIVPEAVGQGVPAALRLAQPMFRTQPVQRAVRNMDPRMMAAVLANEGVQPKATSGQPPE